MDCQIREVEHKVTYPFLLEKHYAHRIPSISYSFGLFVGEKLIGVCTFGTPPSSPLRKGICGEGWSKSVLELNRLYIENGHESEASSFFVSSCLRLLPRPTIVVSFADTSQNHIGYVYQACNFIYTGLSAKRTDWKIAGFEHLHGISIADKVRGQNNRKEALERIYGKVRLEPRPRKHRYVYFLGSKTEKKQMLLSLRYKIEPYPKGSKDA